jgi:hypothetical protein
MRRSLSSLRIHARRLDNAAVSQRRRMKKRSLLLGVPIALLSLALTGCPERIRIGDISSDPGRFYDKEVTVAGRVVRSYGAVGTGVYEIDDGTGKLWVFTEKYGVPGKDSLIGVTGKVVSGVTWGGRNYGNGMRETRRRTRENR